MGFKETKTRDPKKLIQEAKKAAFISALKESSKKAGKTFSKESTSNKPKKNRTLSDQKVESKTSKKATVPKIGEALPPLPPAFGGEPLDTKGFQEQLRELISAHGLAISDIPSLLCAPEDVPRPMGHGERLYRIAARMPHQYGRMISAIMLGASVPACAMFVGISRKELAAWRQIGLIDLSNDHDTLCARFVNDINFAATLPYLDAEIAVHRKDPLEWLRTGPGRWLSNEGTWQLQSTKGSDATPPSIAPSETVGIAESVEQGQDEINLLESAPTVKDLAGALEVFRECGLEHVIAEAQKVTEDAGSDPEGAGSSSPQNKERSDNPEDEED